MQINNVASLKAAIEQLKERETIQKQLLVEKFHDFYESLNPINIIKKEFNKITHSPDIKTNVVNAAVGIGAGLLSKTIFMGIGTPSIIKKLLGTVLEIGVAKLVAGNVDKIKSIGDHLIHPSTNGKVL